MKIIKPYGQTRVHPRTQRTFYSNANIPTPSIELVEVLEQDPDALIAVWVSTIDKIFGKPIKQPQNWQDIPAHHQKTIKANNQQHLLNEETRTKVLNEAQKHVLKKLFGTDTNSEPFKQAQIKWKHKATLSLTPPKPIKREQGGAFADSEIQKVELGCIGGRYRRIPEFKLQNTSSTKTTQEWVNAIDTFIHDRGYGLIQKRSESVTKNTPLRRHQDTQNKISFNASELNETAWQQYTSNERIDVFAAIIDEAKSNQASLKHIVATQLIGHSKTLFTNEDGTLCSTIRDIKTLAKKDPEIQALFDLHQSIKAVYKKIFDRQKVKIEHLPANNAAMKKRLAQTQGNQDLNALIRLGKVIHYQWMNDQQKNQIPPDTLDFNTLASVDIDNSPFWTSLGQFKIKNDEAFLRIWRHCLTLANFSFAQWVDPTWQRQNADVLDSINTEIKARNENDLHQAILYEPNNRNQFETYAEFVFGSQSSLFNWVSTTGTESKSEHQQHQIDLLLHLNTLLNNLRNQAFHFKGLPQFIATAADTTAAHTDSTQDAINQLYQKDWAQIGERLGAILESVKIRECLTQAQWQSIRQHIWCGDEALSLTPVPSFGKFWQRAHHTYQSDFFKPASSFDLKDQQNPWRMCQYTLVKMIYEQGFMAWLAKPEQKPRIKSWLDAALKRTTDAAGRINNRSEIEVTAKAQKLLDRHADITSLEDFLQILTSETQQLSGSHTETTGNQAFAKAIQDIKLDWYIQAFKQFRKDILTHQAWLFGIHAPNDGNTNWQLSYDPPSQPTWQHNTDTARQEWQQRANLYLILHLMPNDTVSTLLHQLKKWQVLHQKWRDEVKDTHGFYLDTQDHQKSLVTRWCSVMNLYLLTHQAKYSGGSSSPNDLAWIQSLYEYPDDAARLFTQTDDTTLIPRRHLRAMRRFGYEQLIAKQALLSEPIDTDSVKDFLDKDKQTQAAENHKRIQVLHKQWVNKNKPPYFNDENKNEYQTLLQSIQNHKHNRSKVLLLDEFKRYQLLMKVLGRLVDYAGLWERDVIFLITAIVHYLDSHNSEINSELLSRWLKGEHLDTWRTCIKKEAEHSSNSIVEAILVALRDKVLSLPTGQNTSNDIKYAKDIRNRFAHFNMLKPNADKLNLLIEIHNARTLMRYDRKLKNAVSYSIVDMFEREGVDLQFDFDAHHQPQLKKTKTKENQEYVWPLSMAIEHLHIKKGQTKVKKPAHKHDKKTIIEAHHSEHFIALLRSLFTL